MNTEEHTQWEPIAGGRSRLGIPCRCGIREDHTKAERADFKADDRWIEEHYPPVSAGSVHKDHPPVTDPVDRKNDLFSFVAALSCICGVGILLLVGIVGGFVGVR